MDYVVGIDVADRKKGFHGAVLRRDKGQVDRLFHAPTPRKVLEELRAVEGRCLLIAADCPPRAHRRRKEARQAERELHQRGYRPQYTRSRSLEPQGWMVHGEKLWRALIRAYGCKKVIETFPTAASDYLEQENICLPLSLLSGKERRKDYKDYVDALICAVVARNVLRGQARHAGADDEMGPIYF